MGNGMKAGDECWVWCSQARYNTGLIEKGVIVYIDSNLANVRLRNRERPYTFLSSEVFPTRKALCEHYRKVFEQKD